MHQKMSLFSPKLAIVGGGGKDSKVLSTRPYQVVPGYLFTPLIQIFLIIVKFSDALKTTSLFTQTYPKLSYLFFVYLQKFCWREGLNLHLVCTISLVDMN